MAEVVLPARGCLVSSAVAWAQKLGRNLFFFLDVCRVKEIVVPCDKGGGSGMFEAS